MHDAVKVSICRRPCERVHIANPRSKLLAVSRELLVQLVCTETPHAGAGRQIRTRLEPNGSHRWCSRSGAGRRGCRGIASDAQIGGATEPYKEIALSVRRQRTVFPVEAGVPHRHSLHDVLRNLLWHELFVIAEGEAKNASGIRGVEIALIEENSRTAFHGSEMLYLIGLVVRVEMKSKNSFVERGNIDVAISANGQVPYRPQTVSHNRRVKTLRQRQISWLIRQRKSQHQYEECCNGKRFHGSPRSRQSLLRTNRPRRKNSKAQSPARRAESIHGRTGAFARATPNGCSSQKWLNNPIRMMIGIGTPSSRSKIDLKVIPPNRNKGC